MIPNPAIIRALFRSGHDTLDIARFFGCAEHEIYNRLSTVWGLMRRQSA